MNARFVLLLVLGGCFDFTAAGRCFDAGSACAEPLCGDQPSRCATSPAAVCDGFEDAMLSHLWFVYDSPGSTATPDPSRACRGNASMHLHLDSAATGSSPRIMLEETQSEQPTPPTEHWIRAFVFVSAASVTEAFDGLVKLAQTATPYREIALGAGGGKLVLENELAAVPNTYSRTSLPAERWTCVVLHIKQGSPGQIDVSLDDAPDPDLQLSAETDPSPPLSAVRLGAAFYQIAADQGPIDIWLDEVAIDSAPLDCAF